MLNATYFSCLGVDEDADWTYTPSYNVMYCKGRQWVGPFAAGGSLTAELDTSASHNGIVVMFFVALIDAWESESFTVTADGIIVYSVRSTGTRAPYNSCGNEYNDAYSNITFGFNHSSPTLNMAFTSTLEKDYETASWGICNLTIYATTSYVDVNGNKLGVGSGGTVKALTFDCSAPAMDSDWYYTPYYISQSCAGMTLIYFGGGGSMGTQLSITQEHKGIIISFSLAFIDSWDGETFYVTADGTTVYSISHSFGASTSNTCQNGWYDAYAYPTFGFNHTGNLLNLVFASTLAQPSDDEAFGICGLYITVSEYYVDASGNVLDVDTSSDTQIPSLSFSCSSPAEDDSWTYTSGYKTIECNGNNYVGPYGKGDSMSATFATSDSHNGIIVSFQLALLDSWDGEAFTVTADGSIVYSLTNTVSGTESNTCQNKWTDVYKNVTFGFNHSSASLTLVFSSTLDQVATDEAWGICDLTITISSYYVESNGYEVATGIGGALSALTFACDSPAVSLDWAYYPFYETVECGSNTYVGAYGMGASLSTVLSVTDAHQGVVISFKLALLDSWDGEAFAVVAEGRPVYSITHSVADSTSNLCQGDADDYFIDVTFGFNHTGDLLTLKFVSFLGEDASEQSWGICDLSITTSTNTVDADGNELA